MKIVGHRWSDLMLRQLRWSYELEKSKPDIILSGFDKMPMPITIAGAHMNIPVAHIQGGEVTGTILGNQSVSAMSKFAHYHFAANKDACERLIKMGEREDRVFNVILQSMQLFLLKMTKTFLINTNYQSHTFY